MFELFKKAFDYLSAKPVRFFLTAALLWMIIMCVLNTLNGIQWNDILVEANGMAFDLLVFGVLLSLYEALRDKKDKIERLHEEIDDYRRWNEKEAMYRIAGLIRRLNKEGVTALKLDQCFLPEAYLRYTNLSHVNLSLANLSKANLSLANLYRACLTGADLRGANLFGVCLIEADLSTTFAYGELDSLTVANLSFANLANANLSGANLKHANLYGANLAGANLTDVNLYRAYVDKDWFERLEKWNVTGREGIKQKYKIDSRGVLEPIK